MVGVNLVLRCVMAIEEGISRGDSVRDVILCWLDRETRNQSESSRESMSESSFRQEVLGFLRQTETSEIENTLSGRSAALEIRSRTLFRQNLFLILEAGVQGAAILPRLKELRFEIEAQLELDLKAHVESLPLKMLVPLLLCMFPAFLVLLLGPITQSFMETLK